MITCFEAMSIVLLPIGPHVRALVLQYSNYLLLVLVTRSLLLSLWTLLEIQFLPQRVPTLIVTIFVHLIFLDGDDDVVGIHVIIQLIIVFFVVFISRYLIFVLRLFKSFQLDR